VYQVLECNRRQRQSRHGAIERYGRCAARPWPKRTGARKKGPLSSRVELKGSEAAGPKRSAQCDVAGNRQEQNPPLGQCKRQPLFVIELSHQPISELCSRTRDPSVLTVRYDTASPGLNQAKSGICKRKCLLQRHLQLAKRAGFPGTPITRRRVIHSAKSRDSADIGIVLKRGANVQPAGTSGNASRPGRLCRCRFRRHQDLRGLFRTCASRGHTAAWGENPAYRIA